MQFTSIIIASILASVAVADDAVVTQIGDGQIQAESSTEVAPTTPVAPVTPTSSAEEENSTVDVTTTPVVTSSAVETDTATEFLTETSTVCTEEACTASKTASNETSSLPEYEGAAPRAAVGAGLVGLAGLALLI